ncbi:hypothetical protein [Microbacterium sp. K24]|uniref:hypothetical protein n=1 Tax=Microbacterium sp. K24 TaxID=2305446 RepID=UPI00109D00B8|nr:hypothetical protein [Microbacterium sp. K24]
MAERYCIRGCTVGSVHFATCPDFGSTDPHPACKGCAPSVARDGALICDRCFNRLRSLIRDVGDLLGRLHSIADPIKATPTDQLRSGSSSVEAPAPVPADLLDAIADVSRTVYAWERYVVPRTLEQALPDIINDRDNVERLSVGFLERNELVDDVRAFWSVSDAMAKWGAERRTKNEPFWFDPDDLFDPVEDAPKPRAEWGDPLLNKDDAEKVAGSARTLRRWRQKDLISPAGSIYIAGVQTTLFRHSDLVRLRDEMKERTGRPRAKGAGHD